MNEKTLWFIYGSIIALVCLAVAFSLVMFFIYYQQPEFVCELCECESNLTWMNYFPSP